MKKHYKIIPLDFFGEAFILESAHAPEKVYIKGAVIVGGVTTTYELKLDKISIFYENDFEIIEL